MPAQEPPIALLKSCASVLVVPVWTTQSAMPPQFPVLPCQTYVTVPGFVLAAPEPVVIVSPLPGSVLMVIVPLEAVAVVVRLTPLIVTPCPVARQYAGATATDPVELVGGLASKVTLSIVSVELPEMLGVGVEVRVAMGAVTLPVVPLPRFVLQSFFTPSPKILRGGLAPRGIGFRSHEPPGPKPRSGSATTGRVPKVRFACCNW